MSGEPYTERALSRASPTEVEAFPTDRLYPPSSLLLPQLPLEQALPWPLPPGAFPPKDEEDGDEGYEHSPFSPSDVTNFTPTVATVDTFDNSCLAGRIQPLSSALQSPFLTLEDCTF